MSNKNLTSTAELKKAIESLKTSLELYNNSLNEPNEDARLAFRDACIQRFEYCIELSWKTSMKVLGSATAAAKPAVREMARNNLILDAELWFKFIEARNNSSHSYDEEVAKKVFIEIELFFPEVNKLLTVLEKTK
jgi:nucleotidyltransferase substrate binding protein (TIGR01987 family)